jgi:hypothetical protein
MMIDTYGKGLIKLNVEYARILTSVQNLDLQMDALHNHGCKEIFTDTSLRTNKELRIVLLYFL